MSGTVEAAGLTFVDAGPETSDEQRAELPVVLSLHGRGDRPHAPGDRPFYGIDVPFRYLAPAAPTPLGSGFAWLPGRVSEGRDAELAAALDEQIARLRDALAALGVTPETNGTRGLVVTGFSQGGIVALGLALRAPDLVATALPSAAFLPPRVVDEALRVGPGPAGWPPIRGVHGEADDEVPVGPARAMFHRLTDAGVPATLETFPGAGHRMTPPMHARKGTWLREAVRQLSTASPASS